MAPPTPPHPPPHYPHPHQGLNLWDTYDKEEDDHPDPWPRNESLGTEPSSVIQALAAPPTEKTPVRSGVASFHCYHPYQH